MAQEEEIEEAKQNVEIKDRLLAMNQIFEDKYKKGFKAGLITGGVGAAYFGARLFFGPEINLEEYATSALQFIDYLAATVVPFGIAAGGMTYGTTYLERKQGERELKEAKSKLEEISKE